MWYCIRKSKKYVTVMQDTYEDREIVARCLVGVTDRSKVRVGRFESKPSCTMVMDRLTDEVRPESSSTMMFTENIVQSVM